MENTLDIKFYDFLCTTIENCIEREDYDDFLNSKHILALGTNAKMTFRNVYIEIKKYTQIVDLTVIVQKNMVDYYLPLIKENNMIVQWDGNYSMELFEKMENGGELNKIDTFIFFARQVFDIRNCNIMQIAEELEKKYSIKIYCINFDAEIYRIRKVGLCYTGLLLYDQMSRFIDKAMESD